MITYIYFFISHDNSKAFKYVLSLIRQFNCEIIRTNQKGNARPLKADIRTPACRDPLPRSAGAAGGTREGKGLGVPQLERRCTPCLTLQGVSPPAHSRCCDVPTNAIKGSSEAEILFRGLEGKERSQDQGLYKMAFLARLTMSERG